MAKNLKRILTGIQSTGVPHMGNILGAILPAINFSKQKGFKKILIESTIYLGTKNLNKEKLNFKEKIVNFLCEKLVRQKIKNRITMY